MFTRLAVRVVNANSLLFSRSIAVSAVAAQKTATDPIQKLFVDKLREYGQKSKTAEMGLVDATADVKKILQDELEKVDRQFQAKGQDMTAFPTFTFPDPVVVNPGTGVESELPSLTGQGKDEKEDGADELDIAWMP